jgi:hypothetical protein
VKTFLPNLDYQYTISGNFYKIKTTALTDVQKQYIANENMFLSFDKKYPGHFYSIADVFKNITDIKNDPYGPDALHYGVNGSQIIGNKIFMILNNKKVFS